MKNIRILLLAIVVLGGFAHSGAKEGLICGIAKQDITPAQPVTLSGYDNRINVSKGIHDSLSVRVVVFQSDQDKLVLISTDVIGFYDGTAEVIRTALLDKFKLKPSELFLTAIHTHSAPRLSFDEAKEHTNNTAYTQFLQRRIFQAVEQALKNLESVCLGAGSGSSPVGANRREVSYDKAGNPRTWIGRNPSGVQDKEVQVMKIVQGEKLKGVLFDYACHSASLGWDNYLVSGDVHGLAEQFIERYLADDVVAPGFAGASGDVDPWYRVLPGFETKNGWIPEPILMGTMLGEEVVHVLRTIQSTVCGGEIRSRSAILELPGKPEGAWESSEGHPKIPFAMTAARIGSVAFVGLGGEVLSEIGVAIKAASPFDPTFIVTHCNGAAGYLPPKHRYVERGYEIQSSPFASTAAEIVVKQAIRMLHQL